MSALKLSALKERSQKVAEVVDEEAEGSIHSAMWMLVGLSQPGRNRLAKLLRSGITYDKYCEIERRAKARRERAA
jgi:hypothetical protein